jgi:di-N-acetylchitobiase
MIFAVASVVAAAAVVAPKVVIFHAPIYNSSQRDYKLYDWAKVDTIIVWRSYMSADLVPNVRKLRSDARVIIGGHHLNMSQITNASAVRAWTQEMVALVQSYGADGLNLDIEQSTASLRGAVTSLTCGLSAALQAASPSYSLSFDLGVYPKTQASAYDHKALAHCLEYIIPMAYDMTHGHSSPKPIGSNSPLPAVRECIDEYRQLGVRPSQIVIGFPWYGYDFPCAASTAPATGKPCTLEQPPPAHIGGWERGYGEILDIFDGVEAAGRGVTHYWDAESSTPWVEYVNASNGRVQQVVYDDPRSLRLKYLAAQAAGAGGVAIWTGDAGHRADDATAGAAARAALWQAVPAWADAQ